MTICECCGEYFGGDDRYCLEYEKLIEVEI